jgi:hypothetical protein
VWLLVRKRLLNHCPHKLRAAPHVAPQGQHPRQLCLRLIVPADHDGGEAPSASPPSPFLGLDGGLKGFCRGQEDARVAKGGGCDETEASAAVGFACKEGRCNAAQAACSTPHMQVGLLQGFVVDAGGEPS